MNATHLFKQSCMVASAGAQDKFGKTSYATANTYKCRFQKTSRTIATTQNERTPIDGLVWLPASAVAALNDKLVFGSANYRIMRIEPMVDGKGVTRHLEVMVQDWNN